MKLAASLASLSLVLAALAPVSTASAATILTFAGAGSDDNPVSASYGDGLPETPDVSVDFANLNVYNEDYGTGFGGAHVFVSGGTATITFTASNGAQVRLDSFDVGTYGDPDVGSEFSYSYSIDGAPAVSGTATGVEPGAPVTVELSNVLSLMNGTITLTVPLVAPYDPALDNVTFSQVPGVPEPAAAVGILMGLALLVRRGR